MLLGICLIVFLGYMFFKMLVNDFKDVFGPVTTKNDVFIRVIDKQIITDKEIGKSAYIIFLDFPEKFGLPVKVKEKKYNEINVGEYVRVKVKELLYEDNYYVKYKIKKKKIRETPYGK